jgi:hypothetical protein
VAAGVLLVGAFPASAATVLKRNLVDLIDLSDQIVIGKVMNVTDGFNGNVPFTEITVKVKESVRGSLPEIYTFRQFGLTEPRVVDGRLNVGVSPDGWPRYRNGETVVLFLYQAAEFTGFRTTVGLFQGKFEIADGSVRNAIDNQGLFENIRFEAGLLSPSEEKCSRATSGALPAEDFINIVRRAVDERWVEAGRMQHAN